MNDTRESSHLAPSDVLHGEKVHLRPPRLDELSFIRMLWGDPETMAPVGGPVDFPETRAGEFFARMVSPGRPANCYCLILNREDTPVGEISFHHWDPHDRSARLNVKVLARHRRHGYAKDALCAFLACFFGRLGGRVMTDDVALGNQPGEHLLLALGFARDDTVADVCQMVMTRQMYVTLYGQPGGEVDSSSQSRPSASPGNE